MTDRRRGVVVRWGRDVVVFLAVAIAAAACTGEPSPGQGSGQGSGQGNRPGDRAGGHAATDAVLVGAGDIASCTSEGDEATAKLLDRISGTVFTAGDAAYPDGTAEQFSECYASSWGRHRHRTRPVPGNHEYHAASAAPYFRYFGSAASHPRQSWYSYELGSWHVVALDSNCKRIGGCHAGSAQESWLRKDLAASTKRCTLAYWHHPLFTSGAEHRPLRAMRPIFRALYEHNAEVVLSAHNHNYERFAPQNPAGQLDRARGIRAFVVGTGGASLYDFGKVQRNSEVRNNDTHGVLRLTLKENGYDWKFVPEDGKTFSDSGSGSCH